MTPSVVCLYHVHAGSKSLHSDGPAETHDRIVRSCIGRPWWSRRLLDRWCGLRMWAALETAVSEGRHRQAAVLAARLIARPQRLWAVVVRRIQFALWMRRSRRLAASDLRVAAALEAMAGGEGGAMNLARVKATLAARRRDAARRVRGQPTDTSDGASRPDAGKKRLHQRDRHRRS